MCTDILNNGQKRRNCKRATNIHLSVKCLNVRMNCIFLLGQTVIVLVFIWDFFCVFFSPTAFSSYSLPTFHVNGWRLDVNIKKRTEQNCMSMVWQDSLTSEEERNTTYIILFDQFVCIVFGFDHRYTWFPPSARFSTKNYNNNRCLFLGYSLTQAHIVQLHTIRLCDEFCWTE